MLAPLFSAPICGLMWSAHCSNLHFNVSVDHNQGGRSGNTQKWVGEGLASCTFPCKFSFCCIFYWQCSLPGMLDWHHKTLKQSKRALLPKKEWLLFIFFLLPVPVECSVGCPWPYFDGTTKASFSLYRWRVVLGGLLLTGASEGQARNPWHRKLLAKNCTFCLPHLAGGVMGTWLWLPLHILTLH